MTITVSVQLDPTTDLNAAIDYLVHLRAAADAEPMDAAAGPNDHRATATPGMPDVLILFDETDPRSRSRRFLEALSAQPELYVDLAEKPVLRNEDGSVLSAASLRAVHRNLTKTENRLLAERQIKRKVVVNDGSRYAQDGAARYSLRPADLKALDEHLKARRTAQTLGVSS